MLTTMFFLLLHTAWGQSPPTLIYRDGAVLLTPFSSGEALQVYRGSVSIAEAEGLSPILGRYRTTADTLAFRPLVAFGLGQHFTAVAKKETALHFQIPLPDDYPYARVAQVYPSADSLPENLLKFHIVFSQPMGELPAHQFISLHDARGDQLDRAFLELETPLWNEDHTRLTLWIEPGRIKQDLGPNRKLGPVLKAGDKYELRIAEGLKDKNGIPVAEAFTKSFSVIPADRQKPQVEKWSIATPKANTNAPLLIDFHEPMDFVTAMNYLKIFKTNNEPIAGELELDNKESRAIFTPTNPWKRDNYHLEIHAVLEDLAGNNLNREFDRDLEKGGKETNGRPLLEIPFSINVDPEK